MTPELGADDLEGILQAYALGGSRCARLESADNEVFRIEATDGARFVLRVHHDLEPLDSVAAHLPFEFGWLEHIRATTEVAVPRPVRLSNGEPFGEIHSPAGARIHVLFEWINGESAAGSRDPEVARLMGRAIAELHESSRTFTPAHGPCPTRWDAERFLGPESWVGCGGPERDLEGESAQLLARAGEKIRAVLDAVGRESPRYGLIHSDTHPHNMLLSNGEIAVLDFCDCGVGHYAFDLGVMLNELMLEPESYSARSWAVLAGYEGVRPLPVPAREQLEAFAALRAISSLQWIARSPDPDERRRALRDSRGAPLFLGQLRGYVSRGVMAPA